MNPYGDDLIVDQVIGSAYQVVKYVAANMTTLIELSDAMDTIQSVLDQLQDLITNMPQLLELHENLDELLLIHSHLNELLNINSHMTELLAINGALDEILTVYDNLPAIVNAATSLATAREALRRSYAEAGYDVVGSFRLGFTIVDANDVGIDEATGKGYTGPVGVVAPGSDPSGGGFVDVSGAVWRPKTPDDFTGTDQQKVEAWLASGGRLEIRRDYTMSTLLDVTVSNITVTGDGRIIFPAGVTNPSAHIFRLVGNNNKLQDLHVVHQGNMVSCMDLLKLEGNRNRVKNVESTFLTDFNPTVEGEQYKGSAITLKGDSSSAIDCYGANAGTGVSDSGRHNLVKNNNFENSCRLVVNDSFSRHAIVDGNWGDCNHKGYPLQGCDGIWGSRSHRFTKYTNNTVKNAGEHGAYLQGDGFTWDKSNRVEGSKKCLIKVGAKKDGNFSYPGETLPLFDAFGVRSPTGVYSTTGAFVAPRGSNNNQIGATDGCFCMQPNIADIIVDEYDIIDNPASPNAIRSLYISSGADPVQVMANVSIRKGRALNSGITTLACADNLEVDGLFSDQKLNISASAAPDGTKNVTVIAECPSIDFTTAPDGIRILGGKYRFIAESSGLNIELNEVELTNQEEGGNWLNISRVTKIQDCKIRWNALTEFNINGVANVRDTTFEIPNATISYPLQFNFNNPNPLQGHFDGNTVRAPLSARPVRLGGSYSTCNSNMVIGTGVSDYALTVQGDNVTAVGNALSGAGIFRLDTAATNCFVVGKIVSNGNAGGGNVVITA